MIRVVTAMRRTAGRDFLVFGRMMAPAGVQKVSIVKWQHNGKSYLVPAVFHAAWQAPDSRFAVALANWTNRRQRVSLQDSRLCDELIEHTVAKRTTVKRGKCNHGRLVVNLPPLAMVLVEEKPAMVRGLKRKKVNERL